MDDLLFVLFGFRCFTYDLVKFKPFKQEVRHTVMLPIWWVFSDDRFEWQNKVMRSNVHDKCVQNMFQGSRTDASLRSFHIRAKSWTLESSSRRSGKTARVATTQRSSRWSWSSASSWSRSATATDAEKWRNGFPGFWPNCRKIFSIRLSLKTERPFTGDLNKLDRINYTSFIRKVCLTCRWWSRG